MEGAEVGLHPFLTSALARDGHLHARTEVSLRTEPMVPVEQGTGWSSELLQAFWRKTSLLSLPEMGRFVGHPARGLVIPAVGRQILRLP
jgi:hypothetical protein